MEKQLIKDAFEINRTFLELCTPALEHSKVSKYLLDKRECSEEIVETFNLHYVGSDFNFWEELDDNELSVAIKLGLVKEIDDETVEDVFHRCLVFPYEIPRFGTIGFGFRRLGEKQYINSKRSFLFTKDWSFYGAKQAIPKILETGWIILVEGYFDVLRMHELGFTNTLGIAGTAGSELKLSAARRFANKFLLIFDSDGAGEKARTRAKKILKSLGANVITLTLPSDDGKQDPDSFGLNYPDKLKRKIGSIVHVAA